MNDSPQTYEENEDFTPNPPEQRPSFYRRITTRYSSLIFLILLWLVLSIASPSFRTPSNLITVALQTAVLAIVSMGMTFTMLTGGIDLSVGSVVALSSALAAGFAASASTAASGTYAGQGLPVLVAILLALAGGAAIGIINGLLIVRGGMPPFVATLAMLAVARGLTLVYTGGYVIPATDPALTFLGAGQLGPIPIPVIVMLILFGILWYILTQTRFGTYIYAVGGSQETARLAGVPIGLIILGTYVVSGLTAGMGGVMLMGRLNSAQPQLAVGFELSAIAASVIGGTSLFGGVGTLVGTLIGAFIIGTLNNGMNMVGVDPYLQQVVSGLVFILAVAWNFYSKRK